MRGAKGSRAKTCHYANSSKSINVYQQKLKLIIVTMLLAIAFGSLKLDPADAIPATIAYAQTRKTNPDMIDVLKKKIELPRKIQVPE